MRLGRFGKDLPGEIVGKLEMRNPAASVKDRIGLAMIEEAEKDGSIRPGGTIIEPTSGNTGIALAWVARVKGYRLILTHAGHHEQRAAQDPDAAGGRAGADARQGRDARGRSTAPGSSTQSIPGSFIPHQFDNPANPAVHRRTTGPEIWRDTGGRSRLLGGRRGHRRHDLRRGALPEGAEPRDCAWWRWSRPIRPCSPEAAPGRT